jgi:HD-GYP domain-containing protein (c-di-GMP phosphodiesterase class II)
MSVVRLESRDLATLIGPVKGLDRADLVERIRILDEPLCVHAELVAGAAEQLADKLELAPHVRLALIDASWLHDIGKLTIPRETLTKPGPLDDDQWADMREHPVRGADFLAAAAYFEHVSELVRHHHERFDGGGYPARLAGAGIPLGSRVICVVDAFDAMTTQRPYRPSMPPGAALEEIRRCSGAQFDPEIVAAFVSICPIPKKGAIG